MEPTVSLRLQTLIGQTFGEIDTTICDVPVITASPEKTFIEKVFSCTSSSAYSVNHFLLAAVRAISTTYTR